MRWASSMCCTQRNYLSTASRAHDELTEFHVVPPGVVSWKYCTVSNSEDLEGRVKARSLETLETLETRRDEEQDMTAAPQTTTTLSPYAQSLLVSISACLGGATGKDGELALSQQASLRDSGVMVCVHCSA